MAKLKRVRGTYGTPWSKLSHIPLSKELLQKVGERCVAIMAEEACKDFAKRGWSPHDPMKGPDIGDSFDYYIEGESTVVITSSFYGVAELAQGDIPQRKMTWLTQEAKEHNSRRYRITDTERRQRAAKRAAAARKVKTGRKGDRSPLVIPLKNKAGQIIFRMAPLKTTDAWVHPGIAKFTFAQRAIRKAKEEYIEILKQAARDAFVQGDPSQ